MSIDISDPLAYEYVSMLVGEYEESALSGGNRSGVMAVMYGSTYTPEHVLDAQESSLSRVDKTREFLSGKGQGITLVDQDVDMMELFGGDDTAFANYIEECLNCNLRLQFDWQLKPFNLLGPIEDFLKDLLASIDRLKARLDPWKNLEEICNLLNALKPFCPQDLILLLMSLKMLLKKYLLNVLQIKIDWTTLLGPLLKALLQAITDLLDNLFALIAAPIDCALSGLKLSNDLYKQTLSFINEVKNAGSQIGASFEQLKSEGTDSVFNEDLSGILYKEAEWVPPHQDADQNYEALPGLKDPEVGYLDVDTRVDGKPDSTNSLDIPAGFVLTTDMTVLDGLKDPTFINSTPIDKIILPIQEALAWIKELYRNFVGALESLASLCSGSISVNFDNLGVLLFILDMISLIMMIIKLLKTNKNISDWCSLLEDNPEILESQLRSKYGSKVSVTSNPTDSKELLIRQGPDIVGVVKTCANSRSNENSDLINQWIKQLDQRGLA
jgi:hypothetical protein